MQHKKYFTLSGHMASSVLFPHPRDYYQAQFPNLRLSGTAWVSVKCCFHADKTPSLRINLQDGHFRCFGCGAKGRNIVAFHCQRYGLSFREAIKAL